MAVCEVCEFTLNSRHSSSHDAGLWRGFHITAADFLNELCPRHECGWLSQKTEVKQRGPDFPMLHRQSACCEAAVWMAFDPRNLLIRMGQYVHVFLLVDPTIHWLLSLFSPPARLRHLEMSLTCPSSFFAAIYFSVWLNETAAFCTQSKHLSLHTHCLISPCRPSCVTHSSCVALSSVCFDLKTGRQLQVHSSVLCSHTIVEVLLCLWPLFISASWLY